MNYQELTALAKNKFKLENLKPFQQNIINDFLQGHDVLLISPTGSGKSLCYQLPAIIMPGTLIVISPLIALMQDQVDKLKNLNIAAECLHSELAKEVQQAILASIQAQKTKILFIAPERLLQGWFLNFLKQQTISGFAIDEAHCLLHWGLDFRPEYQELHKIKILFPHVAIMALTATANPKQQQQIIQQLNIVAKKHIHAMHRPNISYELIDNSNYQKLLSLCSRHAKQPGIIYASSRKRVDNIHGFLQKNGYLALKYHAGMDINDKNYHLRQFHSSNEHIMVATVAFGMGVDKANVRYVIHADVPGRFDQLVQEIGRVGRDGLAAHSYLLFNPAQFLEFNFWRLQKSRPDSFADLLAEFQEVAFFLHSHHCYTQLIAQYFEDHSMEGCKNCNRCQNKHVNTIVDEDIIKLLSCIYRLQQHATHKNLINVMQGVCKKHYKLSTFGIGQHKSAYYWHNLITQIFAKKLIKINNQQTMTWSLTAQAAALLKNYNGKHCELSSRSALKIASSKDLRSSS